jgi:hypothetical protein
MKQELKFLVKMKIKTKQRHAPYYSLSKPFPLLPFLTKYVSTNETTRSICLLNVFPTAVKYANKENLLHSLMFHASKQNEREAGRGIKKSLGYLHAPLAGLGS